MLAGSDWMIDPELFEELRDGRPRTRAELASLLRVSRATLANRLDRLSAAGLVVGAGEAASSGGRAPSQFMLNARARLVLAVDVGASHVVVALTDLHGQPISPTRIDMSVSDGPEVVLGSVWDATRDLLQSAARELADLVAIGIGVPGPVEFATGRPVNPPIMPGWDGFDIRGWFQRRVQVPVLVDNDVNVMALGELSRAWPGVRHFMYVKVATGIGAGIISDGRLQRGSDGTAGDLGHVHVTRSEPVPCKCGNLGCLEAVASGTAIAERLRRHGLLVESPKDVAAAVRAGDLAAIQAVRGAGRDIGEVLCTCVSLINPSVIVIGGSIADAGEHLIAGIREVVYSRSIPAASANLQIAAARLRSEAGVIGAGMLALQHSVTARDEFTLIPRAM